MKKAILISIVFAVWLFLFPRKLSAQVVINEFSPATDTEWVELYNKDPNQKSLSGYSIFFDSNSSTTQKYQFCDDEKIDGNAHRLINITSHYLNNSGDTIILKIGDDVSDSVAYGTGQTIKAPTSAQSVTRDSDGSEIWIVTSAPSPTGDVVSFICPTPTPSPSPSPTPTPTPTATPAPTPTKTPTPSPTKTPTPTPSKTPTPTPSPTESSEEQLSTSSGSVLGLELSPSPTSTPLSSSKNKLPVIAFVLIGAGVIFIGFSIYLTLKTSKFSGLKNGI